MGAHKEARYRSADRQEIAAGSNDRQPGAIVGDWLFPDGSTPTLQPAAPARLRSRYVPYALVDADLATWYDRQNRTYLVLCPKCHRLITFGGLDAIYVEMVWAERRCCQGCRARIAFRRNPATIGAILEVWHGSGEYPQSPSWVEAIPAHQYNLWPTEIEAGLKAAIAPLMQVAFLEE